MKMFRGYSHWVLLTMILAALPSLVRLPPWVAVTAVVGTGMYWMPWRRRWPGRLLAIFLLAAAVCGIWFSFESWFAGDAVLSFFIVVVFLKWSESETRRDWLLLIFASVILAAVSTLHWETLVSLVHMLLVVFSLTVSLIAIHLSGDRGSVTSRRFLLKRSGLLFLLGLPLMLLLFLTFPRIPGPLWDVGLAFGLPVKALMERGEGNFGKTAVLAPGGIRKMQGGKGNVLIAEFRGAVPFRSRLYWRGPVFWDFDGDKWSLPEKFDDRNYLWTHRVRSLAEMKRKVRYKNNRVEYSLRVMPNGSRWLYALEMPGGPGPESIISDEMQLLSVRVTDEDEAKMNLIAYLEYGFGDHLIDSERQRALAWPRGSNPRLKALGKKLAKEHRGTEEIVKAGLALLRTGGYSFNNGYILPPGADVYDRFFFDEKKGGAEYLAGSFAMLMRAAGVPARLIGGFRGGSLIALTNFVVVKEEDAHVWLEVWKEDRGWSRVEPKDIVLSPGEKAEETLQKESSSTTVNVDKKDQEKIRQVEAEAEKKGAKKAEKKEKVKTPASATRKKGFNWSLPDLSILFGDLQKWIINYDPDKQIKLFKGAGLDNSNWLNLFITGFSGVVLLLLSYLGIAVWRQRLPRDRTGKVWKKFCSRMAKLGLGKGKDECPRDWLERIRRERPDIETAIADIINRYTALRYGVKAGTTATREESGLFERQVKRLLAAL